MNSYDFRKIGGLFFLILFALACVSPLASTPASTPVPEAKVRKTLEAMVVQTAAAAQTQTVTLRPPTLTPTITRTPSKTPTQPTPSPTFYYSLFTATFDIPVEQTLAATAATAGYLSTIGAVDLGGGDIQTIKRMWACVVKSSPHPIVKPGERFYASWTVANIGSASWAGTTVDFIFISGYRHIGGRIQDLPRTVSPGKTINLGATYIAPQSGSHNSVWILKVGNNTFCRLKMTIVVQ